MYSIRKAEITDVKLLVDISIPSFLPAHGHAAPKEIIDSYITNNFNEENFLKELSNKDFQYYLIFYKDAIAGFSKVIFNQKNAHISEENITKLERIYLLKEFYNLGLGKKLMQFNIELCKKNNQAGIWLYVWEQNTRAIQFYNKMDFQKIADFNFPLSKTESRPNHVLYLNINQ
jgi:ribosomal protein S18 acetylase RimI-like enzyme